MNTYGSIGNATAGWYFRRLLRHATPVLILERFGLTKLLPRNETQIMEFRRSQAFTPATTPLVEGVAPAGSDFGYDQITVHIQQYGDFSEITDVIQDTQKDKVLMDISERQGEQIGETRELLTWYIVRAGTNVDHAGAASRVAIAKTNLLSSSRQRTQTTMLERMKAKKFTSVMAGSENYETFAVEACYVGIAHTDLDSTIRDLSGTNANNTFTPYSRYGGAMKVVSPHELGNFESVRYVTSPDLPPFEAAGANLAAAADQDLFYYHAKTGATHGAFDIYPMMYLGRDAFGCIALRTKKMSDGTLAGRNVLSPTVLSPNEPRGGDPLGQKGSIGWKMYFACVMLNDTWARRLEVAVAK